MFECCKRLKKKYDLRVVTQRSRPIVLEKFQECGIPVIDLQSPTFTDLSFWLFLTSNITKNRRALTKLLCKDDVLISSMYPMNYLASFFDNRHIQIIYEPFPFFHAGNIAKDYSVYHHLFFRLMAMLYKKTDVASVQSADAVLAISDFEKRNILATYGRSADVVYEGVDTSFFYPRETKVLETRYTGVIPLMHSTGFDSYKGTDLVIQSLPLLKKEIPNFKLFITYTRLNSSKLNSYMQFIGRNDLKENVEIMSFLPYEDLPAYYSFARVYVEPGVGRAMSLSSIEAMACGTPVIRGNDSSEEVMDGYNGFLVSPNSESQLVDRIVAVCTDSQLREKMSRSAINVVKEERFNWDKVIEKIETHL